MNRFLLTTLLAAALLPLSASAALKEGDTAPAFTAEASLDGKIFSFSLKQRLQNGPVVVYFFPSAYTNGCNVQAHTFAEKTAQFTAAGATVVGVSLDSIARLKEFSADPDFCAGKLIVASDADGKIAKAYDLQVKEGGPGRKDTRGQDIDHGFAERTTFVVTPDGRIVATIGGLSPTANVAQALTVVQGLAAAKKR